MRRGSKVKKQPDVSSMPIEIRFPTDQDYSKNVAEVPVFTDKEGIHGSAVVHDRGELGFDSVVITLEGESSNPSTWQSSMMVFGRADLDPFPTRIPEEHHPTLRWRHRAISSDKGTEGESIRTPPNGDGNGLPW